MTPVYKLKDYRETLVFEQEHPKELRWDETYKLFMLEQNKECQGIWFRDKKDLIAEIILTWNSNNVVHVEGFTVLPSHRNQGIGTRIVDAALDWAKEAGYDYMIGEARKGDSWNIFRTLGAEQILVHKNWCKTTEDYISFKLNV